MTVNNWPFANAQFMRRKNTNTRRVAKACFYLKYRHYYPFLGKCLKAKVLSSCKPDIKPATFFPPPLPCVYLAQLAVRWVLIARGRLASASNNTGRVCIKDSHGKMLNYADTMRIESGAQKLEQHPLVVIIILYLIMICLDKKKPSATSLIRMSLSVEQEQAFS